LIQALPAHGGPGLLEVHPHHHLQVILEPVVRLGDGGGVLLGGRYVMDGAGTNDYQQPLITSVQDRLDPFAGALHCAGGGLGAEQAAAPGGGYQRYGDRMWGSCGALGIKAHSPAYPQSLKARGP